VVRIEEPFDGEFHGKKRERVKGIEAFNKCCI